MPPEETPPAAAPTTPTPAALPPDVAAMVASMNPKNMVQGDQVPPVQPPTAVDPAVPVTPATPTPPAAPDRSAPLNFVELRKAREAAEKKVDELTKELEEARKAKSPAEDPERQTLAAKLAAAEKEKAELADTVSRVAVRKTKEFVEKEELISEAEKDIKAALEHPSVKDVLGRVTSKDMADPKKYNEVMRALTDAGEYAAVKELDTALNVSRLWKSELAAMEEASRQKQEQWTKNKLESAKTQLGQTRANLINVNPALVPGSPEFLKHPPEVQKVIATAHEQAEQVALDFQSKSPEEQLNHLYAATLSANLNLSQRNALDADSKGLQTKVAELEARLRAYEGTSGPPSVGAGGKGGATSAEEIAKRLSPKRMQ